MAHPLIAPSLAYHPHPCTLRFIPGAGRGWTRGWPRGRARLGEWLGAWSQALADARCTAQARYHRTADGRRRTGWKIREPRAGLGNGQGAAIGAAGGARRARQKVGPGGKARPARSHWQHIEAGGGTKAATVLWRGACAAHPPRAKSEPGPGRGSTRAYLEANPGADKNVNGPGRTNKTPSYWQ